MRGPDGDYGAEFPVEKELRPSGSPVIAWRIIKAEDNADDIRGSAWPIGAIIWYYDQGQGIPFGWFHCDGGKHKRNDYPVLAGHCRIFTGWIRWHIWREFRVPHSTPHIGVDHGRSRHGTD